MSRVFKFACLILIGLWVPLTQHCGLQAAGFIPTEISHTDSVECCTDGSSCHHDTCKVVESGVIKLANEAIKAPSPEMIVLLCIACQLPTLADLQGEVRALENGDERPLDWTAQWQFVRRAAPLSRAPSVIS